MPRLELTNELDAGPTACQVCGWVGEHDHEKVARGMDFFYAEDETWAREHPDEMGRMRELFAVERAYLCRKGRKIPDDAYVLVYFRNGRRTWLLLSNTEAA